MRYLIPLLFAAGPSLAQCPPSPDHSVALDAIIEQLQSAEREMDARALTGGLWELWMDAPDEVAQAILDEGMSRRESFDFLGSVMVLSRLVDYCPDYAEGYNQRAFAYFLASNYEAALADLDRAIELNPRHVAALSGKALTLIGLGQNDEAQIWLRQALELNPWLSERSLLAGEDI